MISTHYLRAKFTEYLRTGTYDQAVAIASHMPLLLDTIDTLQEALTACAEEAPKIQRQIDAMQELIEHMKMEVPK